MQNFHQRGERLRLFPDHSVAPGEVVVVGEFAGVAFAHYNIDDGDGVICDLVGVYTLPKAVGAWTQGQKLYYDDTTKMVTTTDTGAFVGHAADVAANDAAVGPVRLKG